MTGRTRSPARKAWNPAVPGARSRSRTSTRSSSGGSAPGDPDHPDFGDLWRGATLALEQENSAGGYRGKPFRLLPAWSESPWKAGIA